MSPEPTGRTCAGCDRCCTSMAIRELGKPPGVPCPLLLAHTPGCSVWGEHPASCRRYACLWRGSDDLLPPDLFPATSGLVVSLDQDETWPAVVTVCPDDQRRDWDTPRNRALFARLAAAWNTPVVVMLGAAATHVFAPTGSLYSRAERPDLFPQDGRGLALGWADYGEDRRAPKERIAEAAFRWQDSGHEA